MNRKMDESDFDAMEYDHLSRIFDEDPEPDWYVCMGCGNIQDDNGWGGQCERCCGCSLEPCYF